MSTECRNINVVGRRCGSPALTGQPYCYFHARSRARHRAPAPDTTTILHPVRADDLGQAANMLAAPAPPVFDFPPIEDRESIQVAASMIVAALGRNVLDPRRAASMLYALQVATAVTRYDNRGPDNFVETDTVLSPDGSDLALDDPDQP